jgi:hypothetical protein
MERLLHDNASTLHVCSKNFGRNWRPQPVVGCSVDHVADTSNGRCDRIASQISPMTTVSAGLMLVVGLDGEPTHGPDGPTRETPLRWQSRKPPAPVTRVNSPTSPIPIINLDARHRLWCRTATKPPKRSRSRP